MNETASAALLLHPDDDVAVGTTSVEEVGQRIFETVIATASGARAASERRGFGVEEFAPWQLGAVL